MVPNWAKQEDLASSKLMGSWQKYVRCCELNKIWVWLKKRMATSWLGRQLWGCLRGMYWSCKTKSSVVHHNVTGSYGVIMISLFELINSPSRKKKGNSSINLEFDQLNVEDINIYVKMYICAGPSPHVEISNKPQRHIYSVPK